MTQKQSDIFYMGGPGAVAVPKLEGESQFQTLASDNGDFGTSSAEYEKFTVLKSGKYKVGFDVTCANSGDTTQDARFFQLELRINGVLDNEDRATGTIKNIASNQEYDSVSHSSEKDLVAGDTVDLWAWASAANIVSVHRGTLYIVPAGQGDQLVGPSYSSDGDSGDATLVSGSKSTTATANANLTGNPTVNYFYTRIGNIIAFSGHASVDIDTLNVNTSFDFDPPVASDFTGSTDALGTANFERSAGSVSNAGYIESDSGTDSIRIFIVSPDTSLDGTISFTGHYIIK